MPRSRVNATRRLAPLRGLRLILPGGESIPVAHVPFTIGRAPGNDLVLASLAISRDHAEILSTEDGIVVRDLGSHNGLTVGGERREQLRLVDGTAFSVGDVELYARFDAQ
jgi:pSer/pThr/pTyr-binding forkhead associated (FHA) protein